MGEQRKSLERSVPNFEGVCVGFLGEFGKVWKGWKINFRLDTSLATDTECHVLDPPPGTSIRIPYHISSFFGIFNDIDQINCVLSSPSLHLKIVVFSLTPRVNVKRERILTCQIKHGTARSHYFQLQNFMGKRCEYCAIIGILV